MNPLCWECSAPSTVSDHIIPVALGGTNSITNGRGHCTTCSNRQGQTLSTQAKRNQKFDEIEQEKSWLRMRLIVELWTPNI